MNVNININDHINNNINVNKNNIRLIVPVLNAGSDGRTAADLLQLRSSAFAFSSAFWTPTR